MRIKRGDENHAANSKFKTRVEKQAFIYDRPYASPLADFLSRSFCKNFLLFLLGAGDRNDGTEKLIW
jgi:hypothetical protein